MNACREKAGGCQSATARHGAEVDHDLHHLRHAGSADAGGCRVTRRFPKHGRA